ncbi:MAG: response regulator transcription factor [Rubrivivax sp.]|nr:response regulator transcription factor [Rubrivivax sp.]
MTRLYLLDDHTIVREGLRAVLEAQGMLVVGESDSVIAALADIERLVPDVVLLDLGLRDRSGLDLLSQLAGKGLPTRVLVLTVSERPWHVAEASRLGASGYVLKGASAEELLRAIDDVMQGRTHFSGAVAASASEAGSGQGSDPMAALSKRERQIMRMVVAGMSSAAIGLELHLSPKTVDTYRSRLMAKLGVHDLANLVRVAVRLGVIDSGDG